MRTTDLAKGSEPWRAARAAACGQALLAGQLPADTALGLLEPLGPPPGGWLDWLARLRQATPARIALVLPRPGDPRGLALPREIDASAAVGVGEGDRTSWLLPEAGLAWREITVAEGIHRNVDLRECDRALRFAVVQAAHAVDAAGAITGAASERAARVAESTVDAWVLTPPLLPADQRRLASLSLRMLLAVGNPSAPRDALALIHVPSLEAAARAALEAAFSAPWLDG